MAGFESIFTTPLGQTALLFLLIFTVVFAILQKSKVLGDGKKQIDALVALSIGLLVCGVGYVLEFTQKIIPFFAVSMIIILVFLLLSAMFFKSDFELSKNQRTGAMIVVLIAVIIAVLVFTGSWDYIKNYISGGSDSWVSNIVLVIIIIVVIAFAYSGGSAKSEKSKE